MNLNRLTSLLITLVIVNCLTMATAQSSIFDDKPATIQACATSQGSEQGEGSEDTLCDSPSNGQAKTHALTFPALEDEVKPASTDDKQATALELLSHIDSLRGYQGEGFQFTLANISFKNNKQKSKNQLQVKVLNDSALVDFLAPARSKGRKILKQGQNMWLRFPRARNVLRVSAAQRLLGEASNGDITGTNFSIDYQPTDLSQSQIIINEQTIDVHQLNLESKHDKTTYQKVVFYLNSETNLPIRGDFYARSGKLAKQAFYTKFKEFDGELKVHRMRLDNPLVAGSYTWMSFDNYQKMPLSEAIFHKDALSR